MPARRRASATTATCLPRRAAMRRAQIWSASASGGWRRRRETAAWMSSQRAAGTGLGDGAAALSVAGAELARDQAEVGLDLMGVAEAVGIINGGDERSGGEGPDAGHGAQALDARIVRGEVLDHLVGIGELAVDGQHDGEQRGDQRADLARQGQGVDAVDEALGTAGGHPIALLAEQGLDEGDVPGAGADQRLADPQAAAHMALGVGEPVRGAVGAEQVGVGQGARIAPIRLDLPRPGRVHRGEVRVGDDDLMAESLQTAGDPFAVGGSLDEDPRPGPLAEHRGEALGLGADALLHQFAPLGQDTDLTFSLVDVDANMVHGWPLLSAALTACELLWGSVCHHVEREAGRFIPSILRQNGLVGRHVVCSGAQEGREDGRSRKSQITLRPIEVLSGDAWREP